MLNTLVTPRWGLTERGSLFSQGGALG